MKTYFLIKNSDGNPYEFIEIDGEISKTEMQKLMSDACIAVDSVPHTGYFDFDELVTALFVTKCHAKIIPWDMENCVSIPINF